MAENSAEKAARPEKETKFIKSAVHIGAVILGGIIAVNLIGAGLHNLGAGLNHPMGKL